MYVCYKGEHPSIQHTCTYALPHELRILFVCLFQSGRFKEGDVVRIIDDIAEVHTLQEDHGGWVDDIALVRMEVGWMT